MSSLQRYHSMGLEFLQNNDLHSAERAFLKVLSLDFEVQSAWFNLGLIYKWQKNWEACFYCNQFSCYLLTNLYLEPSVWNLGISASALERWQDASKAWEDYGVKLPSPKGRLQSDWGIVPIQLLAGDGEIAWSLRLDPARSIILSIPSPDTMRRWQDIILHDGAPIGEIVKSGKHYSILAELDLLSSSHIPTFEVSIACAFREDCAVLEEIFNHSSIGVDDWSKKITEICRKCLSLNCDVHIHESAFHKTHWTLAVAGPRRKIEKCLEGWVRDSPFVRTYNSLHRLY